MTDPHAQRIAEDAVRHTQNPKARRRVRALAVVTLLLLLVTAALGGYAIRSRGEDESDATRLAKQVAVKAQALERQVRGLGEKPVVNVPAPANLPETPAPGIPGTPGARGEPGPGPSQTQINQAVAAYCHATGSCTGRAGRDASVTPAQVAAAITTYCNAQGRCRGPAGAPGRSGEPGRDSTVAGSQGDTGAQGPPPTAEQVLAGVSDYCAAHNGCQGPEGPQGPPPTDVQVQAAVTDFCSRPAEPCRGPAGPPGADSTVPGPQGPQGLPGPTCPDGFTQEQLTVVSPQGGTRDILTCTPAGG